jgi:hypothetical protein
MEAPVESVTVPWIPPRNVWAIRAAEKQNTKRPQESLLIVVHPGLEVRVVKVRIIRRRERKIG